MLVLSRNSNEVVHIGPNVRVKVLSIQRRRVRLGIEAPKSVPVLREEIFSEPIECGSSTEEVAPVPVGWDRFFTLLVEDDPDHSRLISEALLECCFTQPRIASTGAAALRLLGGDEESGEDIIHPQLVLLDLRLPDMSGLDVLRHIRCTTRLKTTPVVILSVEDRDPIVKDCLEEGANAFVTKSNKYEEFRQSVSRIATFWGHDCRVPESTILSGAGRVQLLPR
jgi:two-component system, response regulator